MPAARGRTGPSRIPETLGNKIPVGTLPTKSSFPELCGGIKLKIDHRLLPNTEPFSKHNASALKDPLSIEAEISRLRTNGVLSVCSKQPPLLHPLTLVYKSDGRPRLCIDLSRGTNRMVKDENTTFPNAVSVFSFLAMSTKVSQAAVYDLKDGFHNIRIHPDHKKYLAFSWNDVTYQFNRLPFGLSTAPLIFQHFLSKVLLPFDAVNYMDDILLVRPSHLKPMLHHLSTLNLRLNLAKSTPFCSTVKWLGVTFDFNSRSFLPSPHHQAKLKKLLKDHNKNKQSIIGLLSFSAVARPNLVKVCGMWRNKSNISPSNIRWTIRMYSHKFPILRKNAVVISSDASDNKIGIYSRSPDLCISRRINKNLDIASKEAKAVLIAAKSANLPRNTPILWLNDSQVVVAAINKRSSKNNKVNSIIKEVLQINPVSHALYVPSLQNVAADTLSRISGGGHRKVIQNLKPHLALNFDVLERTALLFSFVFLPHYSNRRKRSFLRQAYARLLLSEDHIHNVEEYAKSLTLNPKILKISGFVS